MGLWLVCAQRFWDAIVLIGMGLGGRALAVPPVLADPAAQKVIADYMAAVRDNDFGAYSKLLAPEVRIVSDWPQTSEREAWLNAISMEFAPTRTTRFLAVFSNARGFSRSRGARVLMVQEIKDCRPGFAECFARFYSETLTVHGGSIVELQRSVFTHRLEESGGWTFCAP